MQSSPVTCIANYHNRNYDDDHAAALDDDDDNDDDGDDDCPHNGSVVCAITGDIGDSYSV